MSFIDSKKHVEHQQRALLLCVQYKRRRTVPPYSLTKMVMANAASDKRLNKPKNVCASTFSIAMLCLFCLAVFYSVWDRPTQVELGMVTASDNTEQTTMQLLSRAETFFPTVTNLYSKYGDEIKAFRPEMRTWCKNSDSCKFCDYEAEMLYMLIREAKPQKVFEMAPNKGYSSHWILNALTKNDKTSRLYSYDIHDRSVGHMTDRFRPRWKFTQGDYAELLRTGKLNMSGFDFIFIDALHEEEFSRGYCKWMAFATKKVSNVFTMSRYVAPNMNFPMQDYVTRLNELRSKHAIITQCAPNCGDSLHDVVYFPNGDSPTIFFELNH
jgi:hypothetical protein